MLLATATASRPNLIVLDCDFDQPTLLDSILTFTSHLSNAFGGKVEVVSLTGLLPTTQPLRPAPATWKMDLTDSLEEVTRRLAQHFEVEQGMVAVRFQTGPEDPDTESKLVICAIEVHGTELEETPSLCFFPQVSRKAKTNPIVTILKSYN